jgi:hypothetical protein
MNLPATAIEFLDVFIGYANRYSAPSSSTVVLPRIHVYGFSSSDHPVRDIIERSSHFMKCDIRLIESQFTSDSGTNELLSVNKKTRKRKNIDSNATLNSLEGVGNNEELNSSILPVVDTSKYNYILDSYHNYMIR